MQDLLATFLAIIIIGIFLRIVFALYEMIKTKINNWKYLLIFCVISYIIAFGAIVLLPENNIFSNIITALFFILATVLCFMTLFSYGDNKNKKK